MTTKMPPKTTEALKAVTGPLKELIARTEHLHDLVKHLPNSLPENLPDSRYHFYLDSESVEVRGHFGAVGHVLELVFDTCHLAGRPIEFHQRGTSLDDLTKMMKLAMKHMTPGERDAFQTAWIEQLIDAAVRSGAKIPTKRRAAASAADEDTDDQGEPPAKKRKGPVTVAPQTEHVVANSPLATSSLPLPRPTTKTKQTTFGAFGWKPVTANQIKEQMTEVAEEKAESRKEKKVAKERNAQEKQERVRELATLRKRRQQERDWAAAAADTNSGSDDERSVNKVLMANAQASASQTAIPNVADLSCPATQSWKKHRNGTQGGAAQNAPSKRVFRFYPFLCNPIESAVRCQGWSAAHAVAELQQSHPQLFNAENSRLHRGTLHKWIIDRCAPNLYQNNQQNTQTTIQDFQK
ncbi:hypothetical protein C8R45DRAFT_1102369 [Mycena sanguinolenta]|nr:hypothetical protein C8R45DRAFT_1102369 [Mycena sanguinolenta]